jgi:DNA phosphorothioation-associated putative methyltransferase
MEQATFGKRVAGSGYYHRDACPDLPPAQQALVWAADALAGLSSWTVVKLHRDGVRVSLLTYEDFEEPFPALLDSVTADTAQGTVSRRSYRGRVNPPVLHRKELLLPRSDPRREGFARLTGQLEQLGLLREGATIGTRLGWERRLREAGLVVENHEVAPDRTGQPAVEIQRHLAAIRRNGLSTPVQALLRFGVLTSETSLFDFGCGYGSDVEGLQAAGLTARGWDPHFAPDAPWAEADVVNLGFVLNVIERPLERLETLRSAFGLARVCLAVAVITSSRARLESSRAYGDGWVTKLGTFQKYYQPSELKAFIEDGLGREALPAGPGLCFVFRDPLAEQTFLAARQSRRVSSPISSIARRQLLRDVRLEALRPELDFLSARILELGRKPAPDELPNELIGTLKARQISLATAFNMAEALLDPAVSAVAQARRVEDLTVYFALNLFNGRTRYATLPPALQRDVRKFFGDLMTAQEAGRRLLFSVADTDLLAEAAQQVSELGLGWLDEEGAYWVATEALSQLPAVLRCYAGCAERFAGGLEDADVLKFHLATGKLTALRYGQFAASAFPRLETRIKIDLLGRRIRVFDHSEEDQRLVFKSRLMPREGPTYEQQRALDEALLAAGLVGEGMRASWQEINAVVRSQKRRVGAASL